MALPFNRKYNDPEVFLKRCEEYFSSATINEGLWSLIGLRLHLDISNSMFQSYAKQDDYGLVCAWAKNKCELWLMKRCVLDNKPVGSIFALKAQYGWSDQPAAKSETNNYVYVFGNEARQLRGKEPKVIQAVAEDIPMVEMLKPELSKEEKAKRNREYQAKFRAKKRAQHIGD